MRFYTNQHRYCCGIERQGRMMGVRILRHDGEIWVHRNSKTDSKRFQKLIEGYREDRVVSDGTVNKDLLRLQVLRAKSGRSFDPRCAVCQRLTLRIKKGQICS